MKVKELVHLLQSFDQDAQVILQKDSEGNGYSPLAVADHDAVYVPESTWSGAVYSTGWTAGEASMTEAKWKKFLLRKRCVVLAPVN